MSGGFGGAAFDRKVFTERAIPHAGWTASADKDLNISHKLSFLTGVAVSVVIRLSRSSVSIGV